MKKFFVISTLVVLTFALFACADNIVKGSVVGESSSGNAVLDIMPQKLLEQVDVGDTVIVTVDDFSAEMPFVEELIAEDGKLQLFFDKEDWNIEICSHDERFFEKYDIEIGDKVKIQKK